jgi:hypothetical protein
MGGIQHESDEMHKQWPVGVSPESAEQDDTIVSTCGNAAELRRSSVLLVRAMIGFL